MYIRIYIYIYIYIYMYFFSLFRYWILSVWFLNCPWLRNRYSHLLMRNHRPHARATDGCGSKDGCAWLERTASVAEPSDDSGLAEHLSSPCRVYVSSILKAAVFGSASVGSGVALGFASVDGAAF